MSTYTDPVDRRRKALEARNQADEQRGVLRALSVAFVLFGYPALIMISLMGLYHAHAISWSLNYLQCGLLNLTVLIGLHMAGTCWRK